MYPLYDPSQLPLIDAFVFFCSRRIQNLSGMDRGQVDHELDQAEKSLLLVGGTTGAEVRSA